MTPEELLTQLKDIHEPEAIGIWPMAPGWWIVSIALLLIIISSIYAWRKHVKNSAWKKEAIKAIEQLEQRTNRNSAQETVRQINRIIKQIALYKVQDPSISALTGEPWAEFLHTFLGGGKRSMVFTDAQIALLAEGQYQQAPTIDIQALLSSAQQWVREA